MLKKTKELKNRIKFQQSKGITLIALVITIIVLLILAGVTIASLTGNNGLLLRAVAAKEETEKAEKKERIELEVLGSITADGKIDEELLVTNLKKIEGLTYKNGNIIEDTVTLPIAVKIGENIYTINESGEVKNAYVYSEDVQEKLQVDTTAHTTPWVKFANNDQKYRVLYDASSDYGIEIISATNMGDLIDLGKDDQAGNGVSGAGELGTNERAIWSYTNAIATLNKAAEARIEAVVPPAGLVDSVRCVGSRPGNKNFKITDKYSNTLTPNSNPYFTQYNGLWEQGEAVYGEADGGWVVNDRDSIKDLVQMGDLDIKATGGAYLLATRFIRAETNFTFFSVDGVFNTGGIDSYIPFVVHSTGSIGKTSTAPRGVRPIIYLTSKVKITGGDGSEGTPYVLE